MDKSFDPKTVEPRWRSHWEKHDIFRAEPGSSRPPFCMVIPPPNITGQLHLGHALNNTLQDVLIRYKKMDGYDTLWVPGTDHASIATQNVVERQLAAQGTDRHRIGREKFLERTFAWRSEVGPYIVSQLQRLGAAEVDLLSLKQAGLVGELAKVVKVIKSGELSLKVALKGIGATAGAKAAIEAAGGSVA